MGVRSSQSAAYLLSFTTPTTSRHGPFRPGETEPFPQRGSRSGSASPRTLRSRSSTRAARLAVLCSEIASTPRTRCPSSGSTRGRRRWRLTGRAAKPTLAMPPSLRTTSFGSGTAFHRSAQHASAGERPGYAPRWPASTPGHGLDSLDDGGVERAALVARVAEQIDVERRGQELPGIEAWRDRLRRAQTPNEEPAASSSASDRATSTTTSTARSWNRRGPFVRTE